MPTAQEEPDIPVSTDDTDLAVGLLLINPQDTIEWVNDTAGRLLGLTVDALAGQSVDSLPEPQRSALQLQDAQVRLHGPGLTERWLARQQDHFNEQTFISLQDVTDRHQHASENARLRQQVSELKLTDDLTGLPNKRAISQALELQISRSRRYRNPLSLVLVHVGVEAGQLAGVPDDTDPILLAVSRFLRDRLRWVDQIGRWESNIFVLVLPETELEDARGLVDKIKAEQASIRLPEAFREVTPVLSFGVDNWTKGDDMRTLMRSALDHLKSGDC